MLLWVVLAAILFTLNIGASGAAASLGPAYGSGALPRRTALFVVGLFMLGGAVLGGAAVVETLEKGIVPAGRLEPALVLIILAAAGLSLGVANLIGIPLSTSEVTVGAVVGVGLALGQLATWRVLTIVLTWGAVPLLGFVVSLLLSRTVGRRLSSRLSRAYGWRWRRPAAFLLVSAGAYQAFTAGMNNVANSVGPLVAAGVVGHEAGRLAGGLALAVGAVLFGGRVLETGGKKVAKLSLSDGLVVSFASGTLVAVASLAGIPVPLTQASTGSIMGVGAARQGRAFLRREIIWRILTVWLLSPVGSLALAHTGASLFLGHPLPWSLLLAWLALIGLAAALLWLRQQVYGSVKEAEADISISAK